MDAEAIGSLLVLLVVLVIVGGLGLCSRNVDCGVDNFSFFAGGACVRG